MKHGIRTFQKYLSFIILGTLCAIVLFIYSAAQKYKIIICWNKTNEELSSLH
jgi:hypothetical protein